ncbi:MAG: hypothetical protein HY308_15755 [Gammaproteobacteria bacterium]|nr:hypothetical protein [Gammaproteobacteria bacterium]
MTLNRNHFIAPRERDALISLTTILYIEENNLLPPDQLEESRKSLQALFLRTSGEETMLRKLIAVLRATRNIHHAFTNISGTLGGVSKCVHTIEERVLALRAQLQQSPVSAEANEDFVGPFLSFSQAFIHKIGEFSRGLAAFLMTREQESRAQSIYQIAQESRERLRQRLAGDLGQGEGEVEKKIKVELTSAFNFTEAEANLKTTTRNARNAEQDSENRLQTIQAMCQTAMNPSARDRTAVIKPEDDIFVRFTNALPRHPGVFALKEVFLHLFKLYQHAHGMLRLDYEKLKQALKTMLENNDAYFQAKDEDRDLRLKREKLQKIEGLIPFLENAVRLAKSEEMDTYHKFSRDLSATISDRRAPWNHIVEDLLRAKVQAEAEISTRL